MDYTLSLKYSNIQSINYFSNKDVFLPNGYPFLCQVTPYTGTDYYMNRLHDKSPKWTNLQLKSNMDFF